MDLGRSFKRTLVTGLLIIAPIGVTIFLLVSLAAMLDYFLAPLAQLLLGRRVPGIGLITLLPVVLAAGVLGSNIKGQHVLSVFEYFLLHIPVFNWLYRTIKQLTEVLSPSGALQFRSVVLVEYPRPDIHSIGFVTNRVRIARADGSQDELASVYVPTNHIYIGDTILVPKAKLIETHMTLQEGVQCLLSAGATIPKLIVQGQPASDAAETPPPAQPGQER